MDARIDEIEQKIAKLGDDEDMLNELIEAVDGGEVVLLIARSLAIREVKCTSISLIPS